MKTIEEIKNDVVHERYNSGLDWNDISLELQSDEWPEVCRRAQLECARETLIEAAEAFKTYKTEHELPNDNSSQYNIGYVKAINDVLNFNHKGNIKLVE